MKTLKAGTVVYLCGLPVALSRDVEIEAAAGNWAIIEAEHAKMHDGSSPENPRSDGSYGYPTDSRL